MGTVCTLKCALVSCTLLVCEYGAACVRVLECMRVCLFAEVRVDVT